MQSDKASFGRYNVIISVRKNKIKKESWGPKKKQKNPKGEKKGSVGLNHKTGNAHIYLKHTHTQIYILLVCDEKSEKTV